MIDLGSVLLVAGTFSVVLVVVSQLVKMFFLPDRWNALITIGAGVVLVPAYYYTQGQLTMSSGYLAVLAGFMAGATAVGIYEGQKTITKQTP